MGKIIETVCLAWVLWEMLSLSVGLSKFLSAYTVVPVRFGLVICSIGCFKVMMITNKFHCMFLQQSWSHEGFLSDLGDRSGSQPRVYIFLGQGINFGGAGALSSARNSSITE